MKHYTINDYHSSRWSGGETTQIAIYPPQAEYGDRDFIWRISSATVTDPFTTFTPLPDYHRFISLLKGELVLDHEGERVIHLAAEQIHQFDGGRPTSCQGMGTDLNLMVRKDCCQAWMEKQDIIDRFQIPVGNGSKAHSTLLVFCLRGEITLSKSEAQEEQGIALTPGELMSWEQPDTCYCKGTGTIFHCFLTWD